MLHDRDGPAGHTPAHIRSGPLEPAIRQIRAPDWHPWSVDTDPVTPTTTTVIYADLVGYSAATEAHGDDTAAALALRLADLAETSCDPESGDRLVKSIGDAVLCVSTSPENGLRLAARLNQSVLSEHHFPSLRTGLCQGSVVERRGDIFGAVVNLAARLAELAGPGEMLATTEIADAAVRLEVPVSASRTSTTEEHPRAP